MLLLHCVLFPAKAREDALAASAVSQTIVDIQNHTAEMKRQNTTRVDSKDQEHLAKLRAVTKFKRPPFGSPSQHGTASRYTLRRGRRQRSPFLF